MLEIKKNNFTKKNISRKISERTGLSNLYSNKITDDLIDIIKKNIKSKEVNIKNFGTLSPIPGFVDWFTYQDDKKIKSAFRAKT